MNRRRLLVGAVLIMLVSACRPSPSQLAGTAQVLGCWPYGYDQPGATATSLPQPTPTGAWQPTNTSQPAPTYVACTPAPRTPTLTPTLRPTQTPWERPTPISGVGGNSLPTNMSNSAGYDVYPSIAVHPIDGWAAMVWANWLWEFPDEATIFVKVQDPLTKSWGRGLGVNTGSVTKAGGNPALAIDRFGGIHVVFQQDRQPVATVSRDGGVTWTEPQVIPGVADGSFFFRLTIDAADQLHVIYATSTGFDQFQYVHAERPITAAGSWTWQPIASGTKWLYGDLTTMRLANGTIRTIAVLGCRVGCGQPGPHVFTQDGRSGAWRERTIPDVTIRIAEQVVQWVDVLLFQDAQGRAWVCTAWAQYSKSGVFSSCSQDNGTTWSSTDIIAYHTEPPPDPLDPTTDPLAPTPTQGATDDGNIPSFGKTDRGFTPELVYDAGSNRLMAVWILLDSLDGGRSTVYYPVWSWQEVGTRGWWPRIDGTTIQEPPLALFSGTRRTGARSIQIAAPPTGGVTWATWMELEADESIEVYAAPFNPAVLLATEGK